MLEREIRERVLLGASIDIDWHCELWGEEIKNRRKWRK